MDYDFNKYSPSEICQAVQTDDELRLTIAENMLRYGGSFVKSLGECLIRADRINRYKLADAFMNYILEYQPKKWSKNE